MGANLKQQDIDDDGVIDVAVNGIAQPVDVLEVFYRLQAIRKAEPATASHEDRAANQAAFLRAVRDDIMPGLGFAAPSLTAARKFSNLIVDVVLDVKKNSEGPPTSSGSAAPASSAAE